ncbi:neurogenic differentiation factor 1-like [Mya arenaria]|uniref:neurogenic differentiation factor 1-like n=1 Tax=Mya arenaria TaxID=6604 RepID=UPI0022DF9BB9|nr:neurogenic differentiation factor 1-like [Mya arenaria]
MSAKEHDNNIPGPGGSTQEASTSDKITSEDELAKLDEIDEKELKSKYSPDYNLRKKTIVNRLKTEKKKQLPKVPKPKSSPAPLSKYRRRAANARERGRMEDINSAFEVLKEVLPNIEEGQNFKMTKITTLRLAMNYISALRDMVGQGDTDDSMSELSAGINSDLNSDGDSMGTPSASSTEDTCLSPDSVDGNFLTMDFLSDVKLDEFASVDTENLLLDCT